MKQATLSPDDAAAHMYPSDLKKFEFGEHVAEAFSIAVGCHDETSVPLFTTTQAQAYADARVQMALEAAKKIVDDEIENARHERYHPGLVGALEDCSSEICILLNPDGHQSDIQAAAGGLTQTPLEY